MPKLTKIKKYRAIKWYAQRDYGANEIQRRLKARGLGVRRKRLLEEIRIIREQAITKAKRKKHIPRKYRPRVEPRERWIEREKRERIGKIYRVSVIIPSIPVHSRAFRRNYLGFRINAFGSDKNYLNDKISWLKNLLVEKTGAVIGSLFYAQEQHIGIERATLLTLINADFLNGKWFFAVEKEGTEQYSESGYL